MFFFSFFYFRFKTCWPAIRNNVHGVIFVYDSKSQDYIRDLEQLYDYFVNQTRLGPTNCLVFYYNRENNGIEIPKKMCKLENVNLC